MELLLFPISSLFVVSLSVVAVLLELRQEMTMRLKHKIRKMNKTFFIRSSIPKVKYYWLGEPHIYNINRLVLQEVGDFTWMVSDCEELVGVTHRR